MTRPWLEPPRPLSRPIWPRPSAGTRWSRRPSSAAGSRRRPRPALPRSRRIHATPPDALPGLTAAVERLEAAIRAREPICVWGDFDVDGQTATTLLVSTLTDLGGSVTYHIPVRATEGHGVSVPILRQVIDAGAR